MKYGVSVTIHNTYYVEADSIEDARMQVSDLSNDDILYDSDFNIESVEVLERGGMDYEAYRAATWRAVGQWLDTGRDTGKLYAIAQAHGVLAGDVEDMLEDCLE